MSSINLPLPSLFFSSITPTMDQMEVDDSSRYHSQKRSNSTTTPSHRIDANGGFPVKNGHIISARSSRFVNSSSNGGGSTGVSNGGFGGCFSVNGGFVSDPDDFDGTLRSPTSPPPVAVVGGNHPPRQSATRTITMSLKRLLREQEDFCQL